MDAAGLRAVLEALRARPDRRRVARERPEPSVFAHEILNANPYAFLDDAPLEERRTRAVARAPRPARRGRRADRRPRPGGDRRGGRRGAARPARRRRAARSAARPGRAARGARARRAAGPRSSTRWSAARRAARLEGDAAATGSPPSGARWPRRSGPSGRFAPDVVEPPARRAPRLDRRARARSSRSCAATSRSLGPTTARRARGARWACRASDVDAALARLEMEGAVLRGRFRSPSWATATQWCDRRLLARINRRMLDGLRREIEPVSAADFLRFLFGWQHVRPGTPAARAAGPGARDRAAAGLRGGGRRLGARDPAGARRRLRLRPGSTRSACRARSRGGGSRARARGRHAQPRGADRARAPRRSALAAGARRRAAGRRRRRCRPPARDVARASWRDAGASFLDEIIAGTRRLRAEVEDALWRARLRRPRHRRRLLGPARADLGDADARRRARALARALDPAHRRGAVGAGRWSLLRSPGAPAPPADSPSGGWPRRRATRRWPASTSSATASCSAICSRARRRRPPWRDLRAHLPAPRDERRAARRPLRRRLRRRAVRARPRRSRRCARRGASRSAARSCACRPAIR